MTPARLDQRTARLIVQRTMQILSYSVNVMNAQGVIIASGDPQRVNQRHEGAVLALTENRIVEIDEATAATLKGVKPGINLPVIFRDSMVGVVGISGKPDEVRNYAELVRMAAELVLEQVDLLEKSQWDRRYRDELVSQLISPEQQPQSVKSIAAYLGISPDKPRIALILSLPAPDHEQFHQLVEYIDNLKMDLLVSIRGINSLVVLKPVICDENFRLVSPLRKQLQVLRRQLPSSPELLMYVGGFFHTNNGLHRSWQSACAVQQLGLTPAYEQKTIFYDEVKLPALLQGFRDSWEAAELTSAWQQLKAADTRNVLCHTLKTYFEQNCDLSQTTKMLHIHTNTLRYRLTRVESITGLNINKLESVIQLYFGILTE
ncbi:MAG: sugar diacid recognition domain-containing protein [Morganella sp. (in: enterobacteria)]